MFHFCLTCLALLDFFAQGLFKIKSDNITELGTQFFKGDTSRLNRVSRDSISEQGRKQLTSGRYNMHGIVMATVTAMKTI